MYLEDLRENSFSADDNSEKAECDICGKMLSKHYAMTAHRKTHMGIFRPRRIYFIKRFFDTPYKVANNHIFLVKRNL